MYGLLLLLSLVWCSFLTRYFVNFLIVIPSFKAFLRFEGQNASTTGEYNVIEGVIVKNHKS